MTKLIYNPNAYRIFWFIENGTKLKSYTTYNNKNKFENDVWLNEHKNTLIILEYI